MWRSDKVTNNGRQGKKVSRAARPVRARDGRPEVGEALHGLGTAKTSFRPLVWTRWG